MNALKQIRADIVNDIIRKGLALLNEQACMPGFPELVGKTIKKIIKAG